jgi:CxxC motif-containing protein
MKKELICIVCPNGCEIKVEFENGELNIQGEQCKRGREYAECEMTNPMRTLSTSVLVENGEFPLVSVRLTKPVPKSRIFDIMNQIREVRLQAPVHIGFVVLDNVCGCDSNVIVTKNVEHV